MAIRFLFLNIILSLQVYGNVCEIDSKLAKSRAEYDKFNKTAFENFSHLKPVKKEAEEILLKLIQAKSPMIISWIKTRNFDPDKDASKIATEWYGYYSKMFVIATYPKNSNEVNAEIEKLFTKLIEKNYPKKEKEKLLAIFDEQKKLSIQKINEFPISADAKKIISEKIDSLKLYLPSEFKNSKYEKSPLEFFDWSLAYDPHSNEINVGLNSPHLDIQNFKAAILHEIGHSFDSCRWSSEQKTEWPFQKIGDCLRTYAEKRDDSKLEYLFKEKKLSEDELNFFRSNSTCNNTKYPPTGMQADQLPETFADWFSAETISEKDINSHLRSELCTDIVQNSGSSYLKNRDRYFKIYLANKKIQKILNENGNYPACSF